METGLILEGPPPFTPKTYHFLVVVAMLLRVIGWVSRREAYGTAKVATADQAYDLLCKANQGEEIPSKYSTNKADRELAKRVIHWASNLSDTDVGTNDYLTNLRTSLSAPYQDSLTIGIAASGFNAYDRKDLSYFGTPGQRDKYLLTVVSKASFNGSYGLTHVISLKDSKGNQAVWFTTSAKHTQLEVGNQYQVEATVKRHGTYRGKAQTVLTRCKVLTLTLEAQPTLTEESPPEYWREAFEHPYERDL
jgi:hypothetical protein